MIRVSAQSLGTRKGLALVAVMWVVLVAGLILLGVQKAGRVNLAMAYNEMASVQAHWLARAGIEQAVAVLEDDPGGTDDKLEYWHSDPDSFEQVELIGGTFSVTAPPEAMSDPRSTRYGLRDHGSLLNLNVADEKQLKALCDLASWQVDSILDWRDSDGKTRPGGSEALYYRRLKHPYRIRNGPFQTVRELLLVRGVDEAVFAGEDADLDGILDANEDDLDASFPDDDGDGRLTLGLGGLTTVYSYELNRDASGEKRVNVNTVDKKTLTQRFNFTEALADAVVSSGGAKSPSGGTKAPTGPGSSQSRRFASLMDLLKVKPKQGRPGGSSEPDEGKVKEITVKWLADHLDELTLTDQDRLQGRINVNTAPREVLMALPKMTLAAADAICRRQCAGDGPFGSVGELLTSKTVTEEQFKAFAERLSVRSSIFEIRSTGVTNWGVRHTIVAVVDRGTQPMTILYWYQSE